MLTVHLNYFKPSGKWYSEATYETGKTYLYEIWGEVEILRAEKRLPGLIEGASEFLVLIDVPEHPHAHLHLLMIDDATTH